MNANPCRFPGCDRPAKTKGLCRSHYANVALKAELRAQYGLRARTWLACAIENCDRPAQTRGLCRSHYVQWRHDCSETRAFEDEEWIKTKEEWIKTKSAVYRPKEAYRNWPTCAIKDCPYTISARGLCGSHYRHWRRAGKPVIGDWIKGDRPMTLADRFKAARINRGLTQQQLADALKITRGAVNAIESGRTVPTLDRLRDYADRLGWDREELSPDLAARPV